MIIAPIAQQWKRILLPRAVGMVWVIFFFNFVAGKFFLYSLIWWFDMPMHFLGGVFLALLGVLLFLRFDLVSRFKTGGRFLLLIGVFVLCVGIVWELFEIGMNIFITFDHLNVFDTVSDLFFDLCGGMIGLIYALRKMPKFVETETSAVY